MGDDQIELNTLEVSNVWCGLAGFTLCPPVPPTLKRTVHSSVLQGWLILFVNEWGMGGQLSEGSH